MTTPQQQPEEHYGPTSIDGLPADEAIKKQNKKNREHNRAIDNLATQQTEQLMEEFEKLWRKWFNSFGRNADLEIKSFIKSQLEAAYQRGRNDGAEAEAVRDSIHHQP